MLSSIVRGDVGQFATLNCTMQSWLADSFTPSICVDITMSWCSTKTSIIVYTADPCSQPIYPPDFIPKCNVLKKQWTYNTSSGQCVEFYYHPCGEDREGYDVFYTQEECEDTCVHRGTNDSTASLYSCKTSITSSHMFL